MDYRPTGVCSQLIHVELDGTTIKNVEFLGGCNGNTKGLSSLVRGMDANEAISRLEGITCGQQGNILSGSACTCASPGIKRELGHPSCFIKNLNSFFYQPFFGKDSIDSLLFRRVAGFLSTFFKFCP